MCMYIISVALCSVSFFVTTNRCATGAKFDHVRHPHPTPPHRPSQDMPLPTSSTLKSTPYNSKQGEYH